MLPVRRPPKSSTRSTAGFTLIELLVVISIIATLISLITPAVQSARSAARRAQCLNNMHNLGIAFHNFASARGRLPYGYNGKIDCTPKRYASAWMTQLLPSLDSAAVSREVVDRVQGLTCSSSADVYPAALQVSIPVFQCPDDPNAAGVPLGLSYMGNSGFVDDGRWELAMGGTTHHHPLNTGNYIAGVNSNTITGTDPADIQVGFSTGVLWPARFNLDVNPQMTLDFISQGDGLTNTALLTESLSAGNLDALDNGVTLEDFLFGVYAPHVVDGSSTSVLNGLDSLDYATAGVTSIGNSAINADIGNLDAQRPSSNHSGTVHFLLCDGSVRAVSEDVNAIVYLKLLTSNGQQNGEGLLNPDDF